LEAYFEALFEALKDRESYSLMLAMRLFHARLQPQAALTDAWSITVSLFKSGAIKPIVAKTFPLTEAVDALRYLIEDRPPGRVVLTI
jgi:NADPH2:quinone reductase